MNGGLIHNKKFNLLAFLSMGLFLLIGFIDIFSWIFIRGCKLSCVSKE